MEGLHHLEIVILLLVLALTMVAQTLLDSPFPFEPRLSWSVLR